MRDITDGTAYTIAVGEVSGSPTNAIPSDEPFFGAWMGCRESGNCERMNRIANASRPINLANGGGPLGTSTAVADNNGFGSLHPGGANFGLADGSVKFLSETLDPETYTRLGNRKDGKPVGVIE